MDNQHQDHRYLNPLFYIKHLPKIDNSDIPEPKKTQKFSSIKASSNPSVRIKRQLHIQTHSKQREKKITKNTSVSKAYQKQLINTSLSQDCLDSAKAYWKKLEELEFRQTKKSHLKKEPSNFIIRTLYLPSSIKNLLVLNQTSQCKKYKRFLTSMESDPYHSLSIFNNTKSTSFYDLLDIRYENPTFYPYFNKNNKELCKDTMVVPIKFPPSLSSLEETCSIEQKKSLTIEKPSRLTPGLSLLYFSPKKVSCPNNFVIINYESVNINNSVILREGITESLQMIYSFFHIIIITSDFVDRFEDIIQDLQIDEILISALFGTCSETAKNLKILDFSEIFKTFQIIDPAKTCLFFSSHLVCEDSDPSEYIFSKFGSVVKINCEKVPISKSECSLPISILLPCQNSGLKPDLFKKVTILLVKHLGYFSYLRIGLNFEKVLRKSSLNFIESEIPESVLHKYTEDSGCYSCKFKTRPKNLFIIH